jgi:hypothetical protein
MQTVRTYFRATLLLVAISVFLAMFRPTLGIPASIPIYIFLLGFLTSCWCNVLIIRGGYVGKSSLVIWVLVSAIALPPIGFFAMLFLLSRSIKSIELTGKA